MPDAVAVHLPATHGHVVGIEHGTRHATVGGLGAVFGKHAPQQSPTPSGHCVQSALLVHSAVHSPVWATATFTHFASQSFA